MSQNQIQSRYPSLLQPFRLRHVTFRNRLMSTSHAPGYVEDKHPKLRYQLYHEEKARGGLALSCDGGDNRGSLRRVSAEVREGPADESEEPNHALLQHRRPRQTRRPLLHPAARTLRPRRGPGARADEEVLRAARAAPDGQDLRPARAVRPAERPGLRLRVHHRRGGAHGPQRHGGGDAGGALRTGLGRAVGIGRRLPGQALVRHPRGVRPEQGASRSAEALVGGIAEAAGAAHRRDRHPPGRPAALGAPAATGGLPHAPGGVSAVRGAVRTARRTRLPHPVHQQSLQHRGEVVAARRFHPRGDVDPPRPAHPGDGTGVHGRRPRGDMDPDPGPAVAGERAGLGDLLRAQGRARPHPCGERGRRRRGPRAAHRAPG